MGVIMGKIIMHDTENQTQLILQAGDEESLEKQVEGIDILERKAKAFDEIRKYVNKKQGEEEFPIEDDYLIGRYESYEIIEEIIKENMEDE